MPTEAPEATEEQPPREPEPHDHGPSTSTSLVVRTWQDAWQDAEQILDAHQGLFLVLGFVGGQSLLALILWWLRAGWFGVGYWVVNGLVMGSVLVIGYTMTRRERQHGHRAEGPPHGGWTTTREEGTRADAL